MELFQSVSNSLLTAAATFFTLFGDECLVILVLGLLLGFIYEEKKVNFEKAEKWWSYIVRPVLGVVIFAVVSILLKLPAKAPSLAASSFLSYEKTSRIKASFISL